MTLTFEDLPMDVLEKVVGESTLTDCLALRKVSPDLRNLVDTSEIRCESVEFRFGETSWKIEFEGLELRYNKTDDGGCKITSDRRGRNRKTYQDDRNYKQAMIADASTFLANPKLKIGHIWFLYHPPAAEFFEFLKSLNLLLNVRSIQSTHIGLLHSIVPFLKPESLEEIVFHEQSFNAAQFIEIAKNDTAEILKNPKLKIHRMIFNEYSDELAANFSDALKSLDFQPKFGTLFIVENEEAWITPAMRSLDREKVEEVVFENLDLSVDKFNEVAGMEEWRPQMKLLWCHIPYDTGIEQLLHFKEFHVPFERTDENLEIVRDILLKSPHLKECELTEYFCQNTNDEVFEHIGRIMSVDPAYDAETHRLPIPDSRDYFQFRLCRIISTYHTKLHIDIERKSK